MGDAGSVRADPDPIIVLNGGGYGEMRFTWSTPAAHAEIHVGAPNGTLMVRGGSQGTAATGAWVTNGMTFYLQDPDNPDPGSAAATLGSIAVAVQSR